MPKLLYLAVAAVLAAASVSAEAKGNGSHSSHQQTGKSSASTLRGNNGNDRKGGRYLAPAAKKKLPGKKKPPTLTLKRGKNQSE